jgi:hypothetical protein
MNVKNLFFCMVMVFVVSCKTDKPLRVSDSFESGTLSPVWRQDKFVPGAFEIQSEHVRSGNKSLKFTLRQGDQIEKEKGTVLERAELREPKELMAEEEREYSYAFSLFLPGDFPIVSTRLVIAQWKQNCSNSNCDPDNPVLALRFESGEFRITLQTGPQKTTLYSRSESILDQWLDFRFNIRFSRNTDGYVQAWISNNEIIKYEGVTAYSKQYGYPEKGQFYFKTGLYRDTMAQAMTIYIDDYSKEEILK